ncbi:hypothetical protein ACLB1O_10550 [Escherichia coli]
MPLSLTEINEYLATHPVLIERDEFEAVIFALDDQYFQEQCVVVNYVHSVTEM